MLQYEKESTHNQKLSPCGLVMWKVSNKNLNTMLVSFTHIESVKESIRHTAAEFMKLIPVFVRRLAQREYDFILVSPMKRRMLLKMYCMGKCMCSALTL